MVSPGTGPHYAKALCAHCGAFLRWVSRYSHEEQIHRREQFRRSAMGKLLPTPRQLAHLAILGYAGEMPADRRAASDLIDIWRAKRGLA